MPHHRNDFHAADDCRDCPLSGRREFLDDAFKAVAAVMLAAGASPARALAIAARSGRVAGVVRGQSAAYPVPGADGATIDKANQVILARVEGAVYAFNLSCPHQNTALRWEDSDHEFHCPKHHSEYRPDGTFIRGRATRGMDRFAIKRDGDKIVVDLDTLYQQDTDGAAWAAAVVRVV